MYDFRAINELHGEEIGERLDLRSLSSYHFSKVDVSYGEASNMDPTTVIAA